MDDTSMQERSRGGGGPDEPGAAERLAALRRRIDAIDAEIVDALGARYRLVEEIGALKGRASLAALDPAREAGIVKDAVTAARRQGLPEEGIRHLFWSVLALCREGVRDARRTGGGSHDR